MKRRPTEPARLLLAVGKQASARRLDETLAEWLSGAQGRRVSKSHARRLIVFGAVSLDGASMRRPGSLVKAGTRLLVRLPSSGLAPAAAPPLLLTARGVLYEDDALIAVDKPPGLPAHPTVDKQRDSLVASVKRYLAGSAPESPGADGVYLGVHQRLDRDTSGVVLFAKDPRANEGLAAAFEGRRVEKVYLALTRLPAREVPSRFRARSQLAVAAGKPPRVRELREGGLLALTDFEVRRRLEEALLIEARPRTGRKHQIRVQLAGRGLPILGDTLYGGPVQVAGLRLPRMLLHASRLSLRHPLSGRPLEIESPLPEDFSRVLERLASARPRRRNRPRR